MKNNDTSEHLLPPHGGYSKLVTYKLGLLIYDATAAFCEHYFDRKDRTFDQMVQAARSGVANIVEGSEASAASKKTELKLTNVAKASQEELLEDYRSFLRQRTLPIWEPESETAKIIRQARPETLEQLRQLMACLVSDLSDKSDKSALNPDLWEILLDLTVIHKVSCHWVKGHAENPKNNRCDEMAVAEWKKLK